MTQRYDYRNCQSLFGYAARVHERSGGICQLCRIVRCRCPGMSGNDPSCDREVLK